MDLKKTGKFIQERRKAKGFTQSTLAEKLCVSEKTISKWECGKGFPDTSLILPLCKQLDISANELLLGEKLANEKEYKETAEQNLIALKDHQDKNVKMLFTLEIFLIWLGIVILLGCALVSKYVDIPLVWRILLIVFGFLNILIVVYFALIVETKAGSYECKHCGKRYIPTYKQTIWSMHFGRTRYMKCPNCGKHSWQKNTMIKINEKD